MLFIIKFEDSIFKDRLLRVIEDAFEMVSVLLSQTNGNGNPWICHQK